MSTSSSRRIAGIGGVLAGIALLVTLLVPPLGAQTLDSRFAPAVRSSQSDTAGTAEAPQPAADGEQSESAVRFGWADHPTLYIGEQTRIHFRARFHMQSLESAAEIGDTSGFDIGRRRVGVEGRVVGNVDFEFDYEIGNDEPWRDAYVEYRQFPFARVRAGRFKLPFSLEENTSPTNLDFAYRAGAATLLSPGRDAGAMVWGRVLNSILRYEAGVFAHDGRNARTRNPERVYGEQTLAGRFSAQPFRATKSTLRDLHVGIAFTRSDVPEGMPALRGRTVLDSSFYPANVLVQGERRRTGIEARWRPGPFSIKSEYIRVATERRGQSVEDTDLPPLVGAGWYLSGTWLVTGESKSDGAARPRRSLLRGGAGAIELAARLEGVSFRSTSSVDPVPSTSPRAETVLGNAHRASTLGINWYPVRGLKIQANVIRESLTDPGNGPVPSQPSFWSRVLRIQITI